MLTWPEETIYEGIATVAAERPEQRAVVFEGKTWTYDDLLAESRSLAAGLAELGVSDGDVVAVWLGNRPEWIACQLATSMLGAATVAVNTRYRSHELEYMLADSSASVLVTEDALLGRDYHEMLEATVPEIAAGPPEAFDPDSFPALEAVVSLESSAELPALRDYDDVVATGRARGSDDVEPASDPEAPAAIFYTSGTTSDPKGCLQSSRSLLNHSAHVADHLGVDGDDVGVATLPFCGIWGYNTLFSVLATGGMLVAQTHFDPDETIRLVDEYDATYLTGLGVMFERMLEADAFDATRVETIDKGVVGFISKGFDEALFERIESTFGFPVVQPYGLSEANSQLFVGDPADPAERRKRVGGPPIHPAIDAEIVDPETRAELPAGEEGELAIRGYPLADGYLDKPEATAEAFDEEGWFYTGDLAEIDADGYVYYRSRLDDALRVRGFLVAPREIGAAVEDHPAVRACEVVGAPHPRHGEVPVAFVVSADGDVPTDDLEAFLDDRVADYKVPEAVEVVDEFPTTEGPNGEKVQKTVLRDRVRDRFED
ncbi:AMP-dependent synthetase and ligase [Natrinema pellirubrum DSM 15624]|uniref:AMP-dependent synthetase and ligase n=1 Tax=Natrinema pellirubrum (strain DSM 15624 / CIP 106293 / JCM 10476 / NCIMB 786 / 157) TaxID=797303 RepID=L0JIV7_NATP1|nr:class I adenylate-forming enzyme family protein [Natrinema pellirubrum]AGB31244.1 acyl-CoA synthetase (AMP-forming)/AMP-acid ligase II [Natrinema pellirubrum DSM 15624]ELY81821.1 AMP-dependent synthetase and ligase [Natrinema pellirubrum DSM 15624]